MFPEYASLLHRATLAMIFGESILGTGLVNVGGKYPLDN